MKVKGIYTTVQDAISANSLIKSDEYADYINPLDYDFYINKEQEYQVVGAVQRKILFGCISLMMKIF